MHACKSMNGLIMVKSLHKETTKLTSHNTSQLILHPLPPQAFYGSDPCTQMAGERSINKTNQISKLCTEK